MWQRSLDRSEGSVIEKLLNTTNYQEGITFCSGEILYCVLGRHFYKPGLFAALRGPIELVGHSIPPGAILPANPSRLDRISRGQSVLYHLMHETCTDPRI